MRNRNEYHTKPRTSRFIVMCDKVMSMFTLDLVLRGGFFDFMQHFDMTLSHITMNREVRGFVWYSFLFRMFYGLTMFKILLSFLWIYGKISVNREVRRRVRDDEAKQPRLFE